MPNPKKKKFTPHSSATVIVHEFGTAPNVVPAGYTLEIEFCGTIAQAQFRFSGKPVVLVKSAYLANKPNKFAIGVFSWTPKFSPNPVGGWFVENVRYRSGAVGCVSNAYPDRKWRIVFDSRRTAIGAEDDITFASRDAAARAELAIALSCTVVPDTAVGSASNADPSAAVPPLKLFVVTLDWSSTDSGQGDYSDSVWAVNENAAILELAKFMAEEPGSGCTTDNQREAYVRDRVADASHFSAVDVAAGVMSQIENLLKGPSGEYTSAVREKCKAIEAILAL